MSEAADRFDVEGRVRASFARVGFLRHMGAVLREVGAGFVEIGLPVRGELTQQHGFVHGGAVATILDAACGYAALSVMPARSRVLSVEFKVNLMAPAVGEILIARGHVVRAGRTLVVTSGECVGVDGVGRETAVAVMQATMMRLEAPAGEEEG